MVRSAGAARASRTMKPRAGPPRKSACPTCASIVPISGKPEIGVLRDARLAARGVLLRMRAEQSRSPIFQAAASPILGLPQFRRARKQPGVLVERIAVGHPGDEIGDQARPRRGVV